MTELVRLIGNMDAVQAIASVVLIVGLAFALAYGVVGVVRALVSLKKN